MSKYMVHLEIFGEEYLTIQAADGDQAVQIARAIASPKVSVAAYAMYKADDEVPADNV